jgi:hypothetical protein
MYSAYSLARPMSSALAWKNNPIVEDSIKGFRYRHGMHSDGCYITGGWLLWVKLCSKKFSDRPSFGEYGPVTWG